MVGFHGYGEGAEAHLAELEQIAGIDAWSVAAVQALHPFYTRSGNVVANWMTAQDRELAIADNLEYVRRVLAALPAPKHLVFCGFSQGAAMAARAAAYAGAAPSALILLGGDIPPEIVEDQSVKLPTTLIGRGDSDEWYTPEKFDRDLQYLQKTTTVRVCAFTGGHEWTAHFRLAVAELLRDVIHRER